MFESDVDIDSDDYLKNHRAMKAQVEQLQKLTAKIVLGGGIEKQKRHKQRGRLLARERIERLIDPGCDWIEIAPFAAHNVYGGTNREDIANDSTGENNPDNTSGNSDDSAASAGLICAIAKVVGIDCVIIANDATVKGGSYYPLTVKKHLRAQEIAEKNHLPCLYLVDSGGANLPYQSELFADKNHFGRIFFNQARLSAQGIAQLAVVLGPCTAGGAYIPAMADESIIVKGQGSIYLAGPPLVKAATGEVVDRESLGGADLHCRQSGLCDYSSDSDIDALKLTRELVGHLNISPPKQPQIPLDASKLSPRYRSEDLLGIIPADRRQSYNVREVIARLTDHSDFEEFKPLFGSTLVCAFAQINGFKVGIIANNGILFSDSASKASHFIQLCCQRNIAIIFLQNITGFMVGKQAEASGIAKHGAKMVAAVACASVPKITLVIGGSFGAGNYAMCGRAYDPDFLFCWPNARIAVMGGEQAATVLSQVKDCDASSQKKLQRQFEHESEAIYGSARLWDDGIIDPRHSRTVISQCLQICANKPRPKTEFSIWRQ